MNDKTVQAETTAEQQIFLLQEAEQKYRKAITCFINYLDKRKSKIPEEVANARESLKSGETSLIEAARAGYYAAQYYLGEHYKHGTLLTQNSELGESWLEKARANPHNLSYPENNHLPGKLGRFPSSTKNENSKQKTSFKPYYSYKPYIIKNAISLSNHSDKQEEVNVDMPGDLLIKLKKS